MTGSESIAPEPAPRVLAGWLAVVAVVGWVFCSVLSRSLGIWSAVGGGGIALGVIVLSAGWPVLLPQLRPTRFTVVVGLLAGALMTSATYLLYPGASHLVPAVVTQTASLYATFGQTASGTATLLLLAVVLAEDLVWRGAVQTALADRLGPVGGVLATTCLYSAAVLPVGSPLLVAIALGCGLYWSVLRAWTGSLVPVLVCHLLWDLVVFVWVPLGKAAGR